MGSAGALQGSSPLSARRCVSGCLSGVKGRPFTHTGWWIGGDGRRSQVSEIDLNNIEGAGGECKRQSGMVDSFIVDGEGEEAG